MENNWSNYILHDERDDTDLGVSRAFRFDINDLFKNIQIKDHPFDGLCKGTVDVLVSCRFDTAIHSYNTQFPSILHN